jgi:hypothetical protein
MTATSPNAKQGKRKKRKAIRKEKRGIVLERFLVLTIFSGGGDCNLPVLPVSNLSRRYYPVT